MAQITNAYKNFNATTNKESLSDDIYNVDPTDTPFLNYCSGRKSVSNVKFDWSADGIKARKTTGDQDGYVLSAAAVQAPVRLSNVTQIMHRDATVTRTQMAANPAGKGKGEMAYQLALSAKELKLDMERALLSNDSKVEETSGTEVRRTRGFEHWLTTNVSSGTGYVAPASPTAAGTDGTALRSLTQGMVEDVLEACRISGGKPNNVLASPWNRRRFSSFKGRNGTQVMVKPNELIVGWDIYQSDFGTIKIMTSLEHRNRTVLFIDKETVNVAYYRDFERYDIGVVGSGLTKVIECEFGLEVGIEKAHAKIADVYGSSTAGDPTPIAYS